MANKRISGLTPKGSPLAASDLFESTIEVSPGVYVTRSQTGQNIFDGIVATIGPLEFISTWNATTNTPALASGVGTKGYVYIVSVAGNTTLNGNTAWNVGDWAVFNGTAWQQIRLASFYVAGPASATDNAVTRFDGTTGKLVQNSSIIIDDLGNLTMGPAAAGLTNSLTLNNLANTASSSALHQIIVGATFGDAVTTYTATGVTNWSFGLKNSDSDACILACSTDLGVNKVFRASTAGAFSFLLGNVDITRAASAGTVSSTISNTSNTPNSSSLQQIIVAGANAGDAVTSWFITGLSSWTAGNDNSNFGAWVLANSDALGVRDCLQVSTDGNVSIPLGNLDIMRSAMAETVSCSIVNTENTNTFSNAAYSVTAFSGDAFYAANIDSVQNWAWGAKKTTGIFALSASSSLGTSDVLRATAGGNILTPLQATFLAYANADINNVTGDSTAYTTVYNTEVFDVGGNYNNATGVFTASQDAKYRFEGAVTLRQVTVLHTLGIMQVVTSNRSYRVLENNPGALFSASNNNTDNWAIYADMDAGDTASVQVKITGSTKTVNFGGDGTVLVSFFSGRLTN